MEIDYYIILNDLIDGKNVIKSIFKEFKILEIYIPFTNLIWNDKDKRWRNHKFFNENFELVYLDLFYGKNNTMCNFFLYIFPIIEKINFLDT